jgi:sugar transferase (PEP-CTERM system associated)
MFDGPQPLRDAVHEATATPGLEFVPSTGFAPPTERYAVPSLLRRLLRQQHSRWFALLAGVELGALMLAVALAEQGARRLGWSSAGADAAWTLALGCWLALAAMGLYQRHANLEADSRITTAARLVIALATGAIVFLAVPQLEGARVGTGLMLLTLTLSALTLAATRRLFARLVGDKALRRRSLFLGAGARAAGASTRLGGAGARALRGARIVAYLPLPSDQAALVHARRLRAATALLPYVQENDIDEIVVAADDRRGALPMQDLVNCRLHGVEVLNLDQFLERELGKTSLELILPSWCVFTRAFDLSAARRMSKRAFDLGAAAALLMLTWPLMLGVAAAILLEARGRGPVLYRQARVGRNGATFQLIKFRSMRTDAEMDGVARWAQAGDDRVTRVGRIIRRFRLDELPQLWNVLRGEMSVVGPRPERPEFVQGFSVRVPHYGLRHCVRPGLTGWAQLRYPYGASEADTIEKLRYDLYYVKYQSLRFDLTILLETVEVVLFGRGGR